MESIVIVRQQNQAYHVSAFGFRASSTASAGAAVERLTVKVFGEHQRVKISEMHPDNENHLISQWAIEVDTTQACRVCGCTYYTPCQPEGCHWAEPDLCSNCTGAVVQIGPTDI